MPDDIAIAISSLNKTYRPAKGKGGMRGQMGGATPKIALADVDLTIARGSFYGLLGPNGAGKSTLINILAGLVNKTSGTVVIDGVDQDQDPAESRRHIGVVPQEVFLDPFFPVAEMLDYYAGFYGIRKKDRRTEELLEALSLSDKRSVTPRRLSGGMKRRVLIAKAMVHSPPIVVLDEPTAGVDVELRDQLWEYVQALNEKGVTILLTTHYLEEAQELCDHISIINHGQIVASDSKKNLMQSMDKKQLLVTTAEPMKKAPKMPKGVEVILDDDRHVRMIYPPSQICMEDLLVHLQKAGCAIGDLSTDEPDLEDVFRDIVRKAA